MKFFADFNNFDRDGFIVLNYAATESELKEAGLVMYEGLTLTVSDGDCTAEIVVCADPKGGWRGKVVGTIHDAS